MLLSASYRACIISCGLQLRSWGRGEQTIKSQPDRWDSRATCAPACDSRGGGGGGGGERASEPVKSVGAREVSASPQMIHLHLQLIMQLMTHVNNIVTH